MNDSAEASETVRDTVEAERSEGKEPQEASRPLALSQQERRRVVLEEQLKAIDKPSGWAGLLSGAVLILFWGGMLFYEDFTAHPFYIIYLIGAAFAGAFLFRGFIEYSRTIARDRIQREITATQAQELQEKLDENFFTNLVRINFKYIDKYYFQTQAQANKSFLLSTVIATLAFGLVATGLGVAFWRENKEQAGYVAAGAGVLSEFVAAIFFYLYNQTVLKMGEYHEKLVLTQNIGLALRITEDLRGEEQTKARVQLVGFLAQDINSYLTGTSHKGDAGDTAHLATAASAGTRPGG